jgi:hypothetical protein
MNLSRRRALLGGVGLLTVSWRLSRPGLAFGPPAPINVRHHGARGDGSTRDTAAIQRAIDVAAASGGTVVLPPGDYVSGTLGLRSRITLHLAAGASLIASPDDDDFDPYEKPDYDSFADRETTDFNCALLQGHGVEHVTIVGPGRIDGNRTSRGGPKPIALKQCRHVTIHAVTIENAPNYNISLLGCDGVDIVGVTIRNGYSDGIDPDCCRNVRIAGCRVESRDDTICAKASLALGVRRSTENLIVTDCDLVNVRNGLKLGTESSGDFRNIVLRNCTISARVEGWKPYPRDWKPFPSAGVSIQNVDGGRLEHVFVSGITMTDVRAPIFVRLGKRGRGQAVPIAGDLRKVWISGIVATGATWTSSIMGVPGHHVSDISLSDIRITARGGGDAAMVSREVPEREREYPDAARFPRLPAHGLYCRHVRRLSLHRATFTVQEPDARPALICDDVHESALRTIVASAPPDDGPLVWLRSVRDCLLDGIHPRPEAKTVVRLSGAPTARVRILADDASQAEHVVFLDADVDPAALHTESAVTRRYS